MSDISIDQIKSLRERTGLSVAEVKKALAEAGGDEAKAIELLKSRGGDIAMKKSGRELNSGIIDAYVHGTKQTGCMLELLCETDFVARNEEFVALAHEIAMHVTAMKPRNQDELLAQPFIKDPNRTVKDLITDHIAKIGENIQVGRFELFEL
ncbi:MAG: translation elongation factor Ts [Candidatus Yanofskybacteria bacterium RIFCSPHIGHO2_02_FULL_50_12]|uniref:Elongation factor Ts n=1 Tax=Candidatus Yanofskybacteria bacterium RIFCSPHIGHO2_02_FULL_50_12 TaxID=1802685 RepID=A0A1F8FWQ4_9BACT|nr:MAG: translation elongation factor Ts [Candidatus Yanofskybacteria bacterium RIFCSPHIGHO2_02_FULL_50_12]